MRSNKKSINEHTERAIVFGECCLWCDEHSGQGLYVQIFRHDDLLLHATTTIDDSPLILSIQFLGQYVVCFSGIFQMCHSLRLPLQLKNIKKSNSWQILRFELGSHSQKNTRSNHQLATYLYCRFYYYQKPDKYIV